LGLQMSNSSWKTGQTGQVFETGEGLMAGLAITPGIGGGKRTAVASSQGFVV